MQSLKIKEMAFLLLHFSTPSWQDNDESHQVRHSLFLNLNCIQAHIAEDTVMPLA
jgi:hypothetical protein